MPQQDQQVAAPIVAPMPVVSGNCIPCSATSTWMRSLVSGWPTMPETAGPVGPLACSQIPLPHAA